MEDKPLTVWTPADRRPPRVEREPSLEIDPPPALPPTSEEMLAPIVPGSRAEELRWVFRYYGFVAGLVLAGLAIIALVVVYVLMPSISPEEELLADEILAMQASNPTQSARPSSTPMVLSPGILSVETNPDGAEVRIDGESRGLAPLNGAELRPGYYLLSVSHPEYGTRDTLIQIEEGMSTSVRLSVSGDFAALPSPASNALAGANEPARAVARSSRGERTTSAPPTSASRSSTAADTPPISRTPPAARSTRPAMGILAVVTDPSDARVMLNGTAVGEAPLLLAEVPVGTHDVLVHLPGYASISRRVTVSEGTQETVRLSLNALEGTLAVLVRPWGSIYVDGRLLKRETDVLYQTTLPSGFHTVRVEHPALGSQERRIEVRPGETTRIEIALD